MWLPVTMLAMACAEQQRPERRNAPPRPPPPTLVGVRQGNESVAVVETFHAFQHLHDEAFASVKKGLAADEDCNVREAQEHYETGLALLDQALVIDCEQLHNSTQEEKESAKQMQCKMNKTRLQIAYRLEGIRGINEQRSTPEFSLYPDTNAVRLPSYDEAVSASSHSSLMSDAALGDSILDTEYPGHTERTSAEATQLFIIPDGVQIFYITRQGYVSAPSYPSSLHVLKFHEPVEGNNESRNASDAPPAFLQVGDWFYPLLPGASPVLHTSYGAYIFPDLSPEATGSSVGLMLPDTVSDAARHCLEDILRNFSAVQEQRTPVEPEDLVLPTAPAEELEATEMIGQPQTVEQDKDRAEEGPSENTTSAKISKGIIVASQWISWGVGKGAQKAGELISFGSAKLRERLKPEEQARLVDPRVQKGMVYARKATHTAVKVSGFIVNKLGEATVALGKQLAPHIRQKGEKILPKSLKRKDSKSSIDAVIEVAASGLHGFGTVYMSLEGAAKALAKSLANETVNIVQHKYGEHAGRLTENTMYTAGNVAMTAYNADNLGVKAIAKRAAKDTGKAVLHDIKDSRTAHKKEQEKGACSGAGSGVDGLSKMDKSGEKAPR